MGFQVASRFRTASAEFNSLPVPQLSAILVKILQRLHMKESKIFTDSEEKQLRTALNLTHESMAILIQASCYIFEEAAFTSTGQEALYEILLEAGFDEAHAKAVVRVWGVEAPGYISKLKERTLGFDTLLRSDYRLNLHMSDSTDAKQQDPTAIFQLTIGNDNDGRSSKEAVTLEFSHQELSSFFTQLDLIQKQLDSLSPA